jgi:hypothetical protein
MERRLIAPLLPTKPSQEGGGERVGVREVSDLRGRLGAFEILKDSGFMPP